MNRKGMSALVALVAVLGTIALIGLMIGGWYFGTLNSLNAQRINVDAKWSEVQNQYQRRYDLIPQLVNSTKMYINYEQSVFTDIAKMRSGWTSSLSQPIETQMETQSQIDSLANRLLAIVTTENYPELKADKVVMGLMDELAGTQNRVAVARGRYIDSIQGYNTAIKMFPASIVAGMNDFVAYPNYKMNTGADTNPTVPIG
jgi:LemA protein